MKKTLLILVVLLGTVLSAVHGKDHAYGPWNIDLSAALNLESNSNVFYEESGTERDTVWHIIPKARFEYEQLQNVLFVGELELNSHRYSQNSDASVTETSLFLEARPVHRGGYLVFSESYQLRQNYSPTDGLLKTAINELKLGGGFGGNHLDINAAATLTTGSYSPSSFQGLNYSRTAFDAEVKYLHNSLYWLGGLGFGRLSYSDDLLNDGRFWGLMGGVGKEFSPKTTLEFRTKYFSQTHEGSDGDSFSGLLFSLDAKHITSSGKTSMNIILEKEILPSAVVGADYVQLTAIIFRVSSEFNTQFSGELELGMDFDTIGSRNDRVFSLGVSGAFIPTKGMTINFGISNTSRASEISEYEFRQFLIFVGVSAVY
ncbi:hypothetical protein ACFL4W_04215 [Planctomycetota bacterium]